MSKKRLVNIIKKISIWLLGIVMMLTTINMPMFVSEANASDSFGLYLYYNSQMCSAERGTNIRESYMAE